MHMVKLQTSEEICRYLYRYNASSTRKISDRVHSLEEYSEKLFQFAENYIAYWKNQLVGFFSFYDNDIVGKKAYLTLITVEEEYQNKNLGGHMLAFICNECRRMQMKKISLEVDKSNSKAYRFYKKHGFAIVGEASVFSYYMEKEI